jgi:zinc protease
VTSPLSAVFVEPSPDTPLVWFDISIGGGAAEDPEGIEGLHRHAGLLARRGAGQRDRVELDQTLDALGAAVEIGVSRDSLTISGMALSRNLDRVFALACDMLVEPRFDLAEHEQLLRETPQVLDEIRDDDGSLASRWFDWLCAPGHPYGRTSLGTDESIARIDRDRALAQWHAEVRADNLVFGIAGDIDEARAQRLTNELVQRVAGRVIPAAVRDIQIAPPVLVPAALSVGPQGRRYVLVDKPERTQAQLRLGHLCLGYGHPDTAAMLLAETTFGGMFSSRLMQEIRVKRGWSYGAGCALRRSRKPHWFEMWLAPGAGVAGEAAKLTLDLFEDLAAHGPTDAEVDFARSYLVGAMPFQSATARLRMQLAVRDAVLGVPPGYTAGLARLVTEVSSSDVRRACAAHLRPENTMTVAVSTASLIRDHLPSSDGTLVVVAHDAY